MKSNFAFGVKIIGSGSFLPPFITTNKDLEKFYPLGSFPEYGSPFDWNAKWIEEKLGVIERRSCFDLKTQTMREGYYDLDMAEKAARESLSDSKISINDIDTIIYISSTPEYFMPDPACMLHLRLGARKDTSALGFTSVGCGGYSYGMINAAGLIESGVANTVLIVASNSTSSYMTQYNDPYLSKEELNGLKIRDRLNASMFGDGAGAIIMQKSDKEDKNISAYYWGADGNNNPVVFDAGGSRNPSTIDTIKKGKHFFNMDGRLVKDVAPALFENTIKNVLEKANTKLEDIDFFVFHQVNYRLLKIMADKMGIPWDKVSLHVDKYGNLDTATLPIGYDESRKSGKIKEGDKVLFAAVGAGWQYGAIIINV